MKSGAHPTGTEVTKECFINRTWIGPALQAAENSDSRRLLGRARLQSCRKPLKMRCALAPAVSFSRPWVSFSAASLAVPIRTFRNAGFSP